MTIIHYDLCGADENWLFSPNCWKSRMALAHKGLDVDNVPTPFTKIAGVENGSGRKIPVIRDGDTVVEESFEIAKYLDKAYPDAPSLLKGEGGEILTKHIINWTVSTLHPAVAKLCILDIHAGLAPDDQDHFRSTREAMFGCTLEEFSAKFPKNSDELNAGLKPLEITLGSQPFLGGDEPLFADYVVFGPLQWLRTASKIDYLPSEGPVADWFNSLLDMYGGLGRSVKAGCE